MTLVELTTFLATQGIGVRGTTLFEDFLPPSPDSCVCLFEYGGRTDPDMRAFGSAELIREFPRIQAQIRGPREDYATPRLKAQDVVRAMARIMSTTLSGVEYYTSTPIQAPFPLLRDDLLRYVFVVNFEFFKAISTS